MDALDVAQVGLWRLDMGQEHERRILQRVEDGGDARRLFRVSGAVRVVGASRMSE